MHRALNATCWHQTHVLLQKIPGNMKRSGTPNLKGCPNQTNYCTPLPEEQKTSVAQRKKRHILVPAQKETHRFSTRKPAEMPPGSMKRAATLLVCQRARQTPVALPSMGGQRCFISKILNVVAQETAKKRGLMQQSTSNCAQVFSYSNDFRSYSASTYVKKRFAIKLDGGRTKLILRKRPTRLREPE